MAHKVVFHSSIPDDLVSALDYYDGISSAVAQRFRAAVSRAISAVRDRPEMFPLDVAPIRFAKVERFPYLVFYTIKGDTVLILAIVHGSRSTDSWRNRPIN